jgi:hypothetical protein
LKKCQVETKFKIILEETKEDILRRITKGNIFKCPKCGGSKFYLAKQAKLNINSNILKQAYFWGGGSCVYKHVIIIQLC